MQRIARFEKVSYDRFAQDCKKAYEGRLLDEDIRSAYDSIQLPTRATSGSAGYDYHLPFALDLGDGETALIPTGVRVAIEEGWYLANYPRSGLGFKFGMRLCNTVGIIDSDYYYSDNEGHIMTKLTVSNGKGLRVSLPQGSAFMQGIFCAYGLTVDDEVTTVRNGGFGSTGV